MISNIKTKYDILNIIIHDASTMEPPFKKKKSKGVPPDSVDYVINAKCEGLANGGDTGLVGSVKQRGGAHMGDVETGGGGASAGRMSGDAFE
jgi:hypothetical protein